MLWRDGVELLRDPYRLEHVDDNVIQPYTTYVYQLRVCNSVGCVLSEQVSAQKSFLLFIAAFGFSKNTSLRYVVTWQIIA